MSTFFFRKPPLLRLSRLSTNLNDYRPTWESYSSNCCRKVGSFWAVALAGFLGASCQCIHGKEVNTALEDTRIAGPIENAPTIEVKSNIHTAKWRVYTDTGRERFSQGKLKEAEQYFLQAIEEAKQGFGEEDAHVASSLNNLAELYKTQKQYEKAEPLYLEAIERLKMSMGSEHQSISHSSNMESELFYAERQRQYSARGGRIASVGVVLSHSRGIQGQELHSLCRTAVM